jgi:hypothetical protein
MDLIKHTKFIKELLQAGSPVGISSNYAGFPGLHILGGFISVITSISAHDSIIILGIISFTFLLSILYLFTKEYTQNTRIAFLSVVLISSSYLFLYYSTYFFPQSLATVLVFFILYSSVKLGRNHHRGFVVGGSIFALALIFTHHFTLIIMTMIIAILAIGDLLNRAQLFDASTPKPPSFNWIPVGLVYIGALYYWGDTGRVFLISLFTNTTDVVTTLFSMAGSGGGSKLYLLGISHTDQPQSLSWLYSVEGVYQIVLIILLSVGTTSLLFDREKSTKIFPLFGLTIVGSLLMLYIPIPFSPGTRVALPLSFFVYIIAANGIRWLLDDIDIKKTVPHLLLICIIVASGSLMAFDDVANYQGVDDPRQQDITRTEYEQLESISQFNSQYHQEPISSFRVLRSMLDLFGTEVGDNITIQNSTVTSPDPVVYNQKWPQYRLRYDSNSVYMNYVRLSEEWLNKYINNSNKIYSSGTIGLVDKNTSTK